MSENFKIATSLENDLDFFKIHQFYKNSDYVDFNEGLQEFVIEFSIEKLISNDYDEELELSFNGEIFLKYNKNNNFESYNIIFCNEYRFININNELEGIADLYDDYFSLDEVHLEESDAIFEITIIKDEIIEYIDKNAKNLIIFDK